MSGRTCSRTWASRASVQIDAGTGGSCTRIRIQPPRDSWSRLRIAPSPTTHLAVATGVTVRCSISPRLPAWRGSPTLIWANTRQRFLRIWDTPLTPSRSSRIKASSWKVAAVGRVAVLEPGDRWGPLQGAPGNCRRPSRDLQQSVATSAGRTPCAWVDAIRRHHRQMIRRLRVRGVAVAAAMGLGSCRGTETRGLHRASWDLADSTWPVPDPVHPDL